MIVGYTQEDLLRAKRSLLSDVKEISVGGRKKVFNTMAEKRALVAEIAAELGVTTTPVRREPRTVVMVVQL